MMQKVRPKPSAKLDWPADAVERRPLAGLIPYARNARTHTPAQVAQLAASIREWGWTIPVLVDEAGTLIAGHGRVLAAQQLELTEVPTMVARGWSKTKIRAYRIADNRLSELSSWDSELLGLELSELRDLDAEFELTGFTLDQLEQMLAPDIDPAGEWQGMPEFEQNAKLAFKTLIVHFKDAEAVAAFSKAVGQTLNESTKFIWYPRAEKQVLIDKYYSTAAK